MAKPRPEQIAHLAEVMEVSEEEMAVMLDHIAVEAKTLADLGVDHKEEDAPVTEVVPAEPVAAVSEPVAEAVPPAPVTEVVKEAEDETEDADEATEAAPDVVADVEVILPPETVNVLAQQVMTAIDAKLQSLQAALAELTQTVSGVAQLAAASASTVKELDVTITALKATDDAKIAKAVADLPRATIKSLQAPERPTQRVPEKVDAPEESMLARAKATLYS